MVFIGFSMVLMLIVFIGFSIGFVFFMSVFIDFLWPAPAFPWFSLFHRFFIGCHWFSMALMFMCFLSSWKELVALAFVLIETILHSNS